MGDTADTDLVSDMAAVFAAYGDLWNTQNFSRLKELWDHDEERPFYLPEEQGDFRVGWESVDEYWAQDPERPFVEAMFVRYRVSDAKLLAPDVAQVIGWLHNDMKLVGPAPAMGGECRFTAVLRRRAAGLADRVVHRSPDHGPRTRPEDVRAERVTGVRGLPTRPCPRQRSRLTEHGSLKPAVEP